MAAVALEQAITFARQAKDLMRFEYFRAAGCGILKSQL